ANEREDRLERPAAGDPGLHHESDGLRDERHDVVRAEAGGEMVWGSLLGGEVDGASSERGGKGPREAPGAGISIDRERRAFESSRGGARGRQREQRMERAGPETARPQRRENFRAMNPRRMEVGPRRESAGARGEALPEARDLPVG